MVKPQDNWGLSTRLSPEYIEEQKRKNESYRRVMDAMATQAHKSGLLQSENRLTDAKSSGKIAPA